MAEENTRERILDAAEHFFANKGYHNCSLREITSKAKANLAAVNYHFGSKKRLLETVMDRRLIPLNRIRFDKLETIISTARAENRLVQVNEILRAFIEPTLRFMDASPGSRDFMMIIGRVQTDPDGTIRNLFLKKVYELFGAYFKVLCQALPDVSKDVVFTRFLFAIGAMAHSMMRMNHPELSENLPGGISHNMDTNMLIEHLVRFVSKGMEGS